MLIPKVTKYANVGTNEPFVARIWVGLNEIVDYLGLQQKEKEALNNLIGDLATDLIQAHQSLEEIRKIEKVANNKVISELEKHYKDLYDYCWRAYKDKMSNLLLKFGFNISFLFKDDKEFIKGINKFKLQNPSIKKDFYSIFLNDRKTWQNQLATFRNNLIHHKKESYNEQYKFFDLNSAETIFSNCWEAIEDILVILLSLKLSDNFCLVQIPEEKRDAACPKRFRVTINEELERSLQKTIEKNKK